MGNGFPVWGSARRHFKWLLKVSPTIQPKIEKKKKKEFLISCVAHFSSTDRIIRMRKEEKRMRGSSLSYSV
jgi:hypothetical protein